MYNADDICKGVHLLFLQLKEERLDQFVDFESFHTTLVAYIINLGVTECVEDAIEQIKKIQASILNFIHLQSVAIYSMR